MNYFYLRFFREEDNTFWAKNACLESFAWCAKALTTELVSTIRYRKIAAIFFQIVKFMIEMFLNYSCGVSKRRGHGLLSFRLVICKVWNSKMWWSRQHNLRETGPPKIIWTNSVVSAFACLFNIRLQFFSFNAP